MTTFVGKPRKSLTYEHVFGTLDFMDGTPLTALRHAAGTVLDTAGEFVADPAVADVDCGIGLLTGLISRLEGFRLRLLRTRGIVDRTVLSAELGVTRGQAAQLIRVIERLASLPVLHDALETGAVIRESRDDRRHAQHPRTSHRRQG